MDKTRSARPAAPTTTSAPAALAPVVRRTSNPFLYSAGPLVKFDICRDYLGGQHYVWCSDSFDCRHHFLHAGPVDTPASSNPAEIFERLKAATDPKRPDWHDPSIAAWKLKIKGMAGDWLASGLINAQAEEDIVFLLDRAEIVQWRPLIYVIHREKVESRLIEVPLRDRASLEMEYKLPDLRADEFDVIGP